MFSPRLRKSLRVAPITGTALILCAALYPSSAYAQAAHASPAPDRARMEEVLKGLNRGSAAGQVAVSPDGKRLAWIQNEKDGVEIRVAPLDDLKKSERVTAAAKPDEHCREGELAWAPDAKALAFFSDCEREGGQADLYLARLDGRPAQRLTELKGAWMRRPFRRTGRAWPFYMSRARPGRPGRWRPSSRLLV